MKALIFNSGTGSRMGNLTQSCPKCLLKLMDGETLLARQLRILREAGITYVIITTGKYEQEIAKECLKYPDMKIILVNNPLYETTNYIYSMYLAGIYLDDDILMIHGDLVFDRKAVMDIIHDFRPSVCFADRNIPVSDKDFKGRIKNGCIKEISVNISGDDCYALQPMYRLSKDCIRNWLDEIKIFIKEGITDVYAENALNNILEKNQICSLSYSGCYVSEIDTPEDYERVSREIYITDRGTRFDISCLSNLILSHRCIRPFAVMGKHVKESKVSKLLDIVGFDVGRFYKVKENPDEKSIRAAQRAFEKHNADLLISIGGGSAIDTAKGIKYNLCSNSECCNIPHIAVPTTAGSGSEATHFAVIYKNGEKTSLEDASLLPENIILDSRLLYSLSEQQRKVSLLDALCHGVESILSRNCTDKSRDYALYSIGLITENYKEYISGNTDVYRDILLASDYAGRAINISKTTVGHAMSYVLTSDFGIKHGQAAAICLIHALNYAEKNNCLTTGYDLLYNELGCEIGQSISGRLLEIYNDMQPENNFELSTADAAKLSGKVNAQRLSNCAIVFDNKALEKIYADIIKEASEMNS